MNGFEYTSVQVSMSERMIPHRDANNIGPSWTILMGDFQGGLLGAAFQGRTNTSSMRCTRNGTTCEGK
eukprot:6261130-Prorocentrum_lima.AAC.1